MTGYQKKHYPYPELADVPVGGSFLQVFERNMAPWAAQLQTHAGDFTRFEEP